jgi:hypothetical protein
MQIPNLEMGLTVEIFPCITLVYVKPSLKATTLRIFPYMKSNIIRGYMLLIKKFRK